MSYCEQLREIEEAVKSWRIQDIGIETDLFEIIRGGS